MLGYVVRRLLIAVPTIVGVATVAFLLIRLIPGDPGQVLGGPEASTADIQQIDHQMGLDQPLWRQYLMFLLNVGQGNFGLSIANGVTVRQELLERAPYTIELTAAAVAIALVAGVALGVLAATKQNSTVDALISSAAVVGASTPAYVSGLVLIVVFAVSLHVLPAGGTTSPLSLVLPALTLALVEVGVVARQTRSAMLEVMRLDFVRTARAKGANRRVVLFRHALRNAALPVVTVVGLQFGGLLSGAVITETIFGWPGEGSLMIHAISARDYATVQGVVLVFATVLILVNLATDLTYAVFDPRVRYE
jgi:ABC-type dipeptide/oligopeptide/nickel transport system permease component